MESELQKFRQKKRVEKYKGQVIDNIRNGWSSLTGRITRALLPENEEDSNKSDDDDGGSTDERSQAKYSEGSQANVSKRKAKKRSSISINESNESAKDETIPKSSNSQLLGYITIICKVLIWLCLFMGFLKLELGAIFVIVSTFWLIWTNTSTRRRKKGGPGEVVPSAYSVFNPNCEAIDGTLKAEQLEKQLLFKETK